MAVKVEAYVLHKGGKEIQVPAHERASWGSKGGRNLVKGDNGKPQVFFRLAGRSARAKGTGRCPSPVTSPRSRSARPSS